jgi:hypothetical protein
MPHDPHQYSQKKEMLSHFLSSRIPVAPRQLYLFSCQLVKDQERLLRSTVIFDLFSLACPFKSLWCTGHRQRTACNLVL